LKIGEVIMLSDFSKLLGHRLSLPLPGRVAQLLMAHTERRMNLARYKVPQDAQWGSVLVLLYEEDQQIKFPLILRPTYDGVHSGQVALPGGRFEAEDQNLSTTALRETGEEIGVPVTDIELLGELTELYIPPSNFLVHPYVGIIRYAPDFFPDVNEVEEIIHVSLDDLVNDSLIEEKEIRLSNGLTIISPTFNFQSHTVWGATAMILNEMKTLVMEIEER